MKNEFTVTVKCEDGILMTKKVTYVPGVSRKFDLMENSTVELKGSIEQYGFLFYEELAERIAEDPQLFAQILESTFFLEIGVNKYTVLRSFIDMITNLPADAPKLKLYAPKLPDLIMSCYNVDTLFLFSERTTLTGEIKIKRPFLFRIDDTLLARLAEKYKIVELDASDNMHITTVTPFATSLRRLNASGRDCRIGDEALKDAHWIEDLNATNNQHITTVKPFAPQLRFLTASHSSKIGDEGLREATNLVYLRVYDNYLVTTTDPFARTLRYLDAGGKDCGIDDSGIRHLTSLRELSHISNYKIGNIMHLKQTLVKCTC